MGAYQGILVEYENYVEKKMQLQNGPHVDSNFEACFFQHKTKKQKKNSACVMWHRLLAERSFCLKQADQRSQE